MLLEMYVNELVVSVAVGRPGGVGGRERYHWKLPTDRT